MDGLSLRRRRCARFAVAGAAVGTIAISAFLSTGTWDSGELAGEIFFTVVLAALTVVPLILMAAAGLRDGARYGVPAACGVAVTLVIETWVIVGVTVSDSSTAGVAVVFLPIYDLVGVLVCWWGRVIVRAGERTRQRGTLQA